MAARKPSTDASSLDELVRGRATGLSRILRQRRHLERLQELRIIADGGFAAQGVVERLTPILIEFSKATNRALRVNSLNLLIELGSPIATSFILECLRSEDEETRKLSARGLRQLQDCSWHLLPDLLAALTHTDSSVRVDAGEALYRLDYSQPAPVEEVLNALSASDDTRAGETVAWWLTRNGSGAVPTLGRSLISSAAAERLAALKALYFLRAFSGETQRLVLALLEDSSLPIRCWATIANAEAERASFQRWVDPLVEVLKISASDYYSPSLLQDAVALLARSGERAAHAVPTILSRCREMDRNAWTIPIEAFGSAAIPAIQAALAAGRVPEHMAIVWLSKLHAYSVTDLEQLVDKGENALEAARCLGLLGDDGIAAARKLLDRPEKASIHASIVDGMRNAGSAATDLLAGALASGTPQAKLAAAHMIADTRMDPGTERLERALQDPTDRVRVASACALIRLGRPGASNAVLSKEWQTSPAMVASEIERTTAFAEELLAPAIAQLARSETCFYMIGAVGVLASGSSNSMRERSIEALSAISGLWNSVRSKAAWTAARLEKPDIEVPFRTLRLGV